MAQKDEPTVEAVPFEVRMVSHELINPAPYNPKIELTPRDQEWQEIEQSLDRWGTIDPLVWNETTGTLVGGHTRLRIRSHQGFKSSPCSIVHIEDLAEEMALNRALDGMRGRPDPVKLTAVLEAIEARRPDLYDSLGLNRAAKEIPVSSKTIGGGKSTTADEHLVGPPAMDLMPYEHYDYVMLVFSDQRDFAAAVDHFGLKQVSAPEYVGQKAIGLGRVVDGGKYLEMMRSRHAVHGTPASAAGKAAPKRKRSRKKTEATQS